MALTVYHMICQASSSERPGLVLREIDPTAPNEHSNQMFYDGRIRGNDRHDSASYCPLGIAKTCERPCLQVLPGRLPIPRVHIVSCNATVQITFNSSALSFLLVIG